MCPHCDGQDPGTTPNLVCVASNKTPTSGFPQGSRSVLGPVPLKLTTVLMQICSAWDHVMSLPTCKGVQPVKAEQSPEVVLIMYLPNGYSLFYSSPYHEAMQITALWL